MRKRNVSYLINSIIWHLILLMPVILYVVQLLPFFYFNVNSDLYSDYLSTFLDPDFILTNSPLLNSMQSVTFYESIADFGQFFALKSPLIYAYVTYVIVAWIFRLVLEVLLFIPKVSHNWMTSFSRKSGGEE